MPGDDDDEAQARDDAQAQRDQANVKAAQEAFEQREREERERGGS